MIIYDHVCFIATNDGDDRGQFNAKKQMGNCHIYNIYIYIWYGAGSSGHPGPSWAMSLLGLALIGLPCALMGRALMVPPWALMGRALMAPLGQVFTMFPSA